MFLENFAFGYLVGLFMAVSIASFVEIYLFFKNRRAIKILMVNKKTGESKLVTKIISKNDDGVIIDGKFCSFDKFIQ